MDGGRELLRCVCVAESVIFFGCRSTWECELKSYKLVRRERRGGRGSHVTSQEHICWPGWPGALHDSRILMVSWCEVDMVATLCRIPPHTHTQSRVGSVFLLLFLLLASRQFVVTLLNYVFPVCLLKCNGPCSSSHLGFLSVLSCTWPQVAQATRGMSNELGVKLSLLTDYATKYEIT